MKHVVWMGRLLQASRWSHWPACRLLSRTIFRFATCQRHAAREYSKDTFLPTPPQPWNDCALPAPSLSEKRIATNLRWARQPRTPDTTSLGTRITSIVFPADLAADLLPVWLPELHSLHSARIREDRCEPPLRSAAWSV